MIDLSDFEDVARARLKDAIVLTFGDRYDGAIYLCGFAVEIAFKIKISKELLEELDKLQLNFKLN